MPEPPEYTSSSESHYELLLIASEIRTFGQEVCSRLDALKDMAIALTPSLEASLPDRLMEIIEESHARSIDLQDKAAAYLENQKRHAESYIESLEEEPGDE